MPNYAMVLSDSLYALYHGFRHGQGSECHQTEQLLNLLQVPVLTNVNQLKRLDIDNKALVSQLTSAGKIGQTLEELSEQTFFKIILSEDKNNYPFVSIAEDVVRSSFAMTFMPGQSRQKAHEFIKAQLRNASRIFVYDRYFDQNWSNSRRFFSELMPARSIHVYYPEDHLSQERISELKKVCSSWSFAKDQANQTYRKLHDRYLLIDSDLEIILTSGFDNLFDSRAECTVLFRKLQTKTGSPRP